MENMPEELLGELTERVTSTTVKEVGRQGVRFSQNSQGRIRGLYDATHMATIDALFKPDGTFEGEIRGMEMTTEGDAILVQGHATGRMTGPMTIRLEGSVTRQTTSKKLAWLNSAKIRFEGTADMVTGEAKEKVFAQR